MKTDREMTESLLKRRDEYNSAKLRRGANLRLIPKIGVPVCAAVGLITVLSLNKNLFTGGSANGKDINLVSSAPQSALLTDKNYPDQLTEKTTSISENRGYSAEELLSEEIKTEHEIIVQDDVGIPEKIILDKVIYSYIDLYTFSVRENEGKDMFDNAIFYPAGSVTFEMPGEEKDYTRFISCTAFDMISSEDFAAIVINGSIQIYIKERSARFETEDTIFEVEAPLTEFSQYKISDQIFYEDDECTVLNAEEKSSGDVLKDIWVVFDKDMGFSQGYLCFSSYPRQNYGLATDSFGKVMDKSDNVLKHFLKNGSDNYYNIVGTLWTNNGKAEKTESLNYLGKTYEKVSSENYDNATLRQLRNININGNTYTLFEVNGRSDTTAIIEYGELSFFHHTYEIQLSNTIEPISAKELWALKEDLKNNYINLDSISPESINAYYDGGYNAQFYYKGDEEEQYAVVIAVDGPNGADRLTIADMNSEKRVDIFIGTDNIDDYIYFDGDKVKIDFDKQ